MRRPGVVGGEWWVARCGRRWPKAVEAALGGLVALAMAIGGVATDAAHRSPQPISVLSVEVACDGTRGEDGSISISYCIRSFAVARDGTVTEVEEWRTDNYTSAMGATNWTVPTGVSSITVDVKGAGGGGGGSAGLGFGGNGAAGGAGGRVQGTIAVTVGEVISTWVGTGGSGGGTGSAAGAGGAGGTSGASGGNGGSASGGGSGRGGGGGAASRISSDTRGLLFVAGGGGGGGGGFVGGNNGAAGGGGGGSAPGAGSNVPGSGPAGGGAGNNGAGGGGGAGTGGAGNGTAGGTENGGTGGNDNGTGNNGAGGGGGGGWGGGGGGGGGNNGSFGGAGGGGGDGFAHGSATSITYTTSGGGAGGGAGVDPAAGSSGSSATSTIVYHDPPSAPASITSPTAASTWNNSLTITNTAATLGVDGGTLQYEWDISTDGGSNWSALSALATSLSRTVDISAVASTTTARVRVRAHDGTTYGAYTTLAANFIIQHNQAPNAPTLVAPTNGSTQDLAAGFTFDWTFSDPDSGDSQSAYYLRRKVSGAGSYEYWNETLGVFQSTEVKNSIPATLKAFAASKWSNGGTIYNWSVATEDALGTKGAYASDWTVTGSSAPTLTVDDPTGTVTDTSQPVVAWTVSDAEGDDQQTYEIRVFTAAQYGIGGFDPATSPATWTTSGEVASVTARDRQIGDGGSSGGLSLDNGVSYRAYVRVKAGDVYSSWQYSGFTLDLTQPPAPSVSVTQGEDPVSGSPRLEIMLTGTHDPNLLTPNQASLETNTVGWEADQQCTIARSTAQAADGSASLAITATGASPFARTLAGASGVPISPDTTYTALASFRAATTARTVRIRIRFYTAAGAFISETEQTGADVTTGWTQVAVSAVSPANAAFAAMAVGISAASVGGVHYVDQAMIAEGTVTTWILPDRYTDSTYRVEFTDDPDDETSWETLVSGVAIDSNLEATVYDHTARNRTPRTYRALLDAVV